MVARQATAEAASGMMARVATMISGRFAPAVAERMAASAVPIAGAIGGATVNVVFTRHYQQLARGHFAVRALERRYGYGVVQGAYDRILAGGWRLILLASMI